MCPKLNTYGASLLKGSVIPTGCIVAAEAVITKTFKNENTLLAGNPAVEKKHGVTYINNNKIVLCTDATLS